MGVQGYIEASLGRHDLEAVAHLERGIGKGREGAVGHLLDGHAQFLVMDPVTDRVGAADLLAGDSMAQGQVLPLGEAEGILQRLGNMESQGDGVAGLAAHILDGQGVKVAHGDGLQGDVTPG